ncbi:MAG: hypothetical protein H6850_00690 [Alphaproteobacteria bacterium]|nr:MAG: hypothetical protein H6850_00690 [Alphaproteobacteria bacterium]
MFFQLHTAQPQQQQIVHQVITHLNRSQDKLRDNKKMFLEGSEKIAAALGFIFSHYGLNQSELNKTMHIINAVISCAFPLVHTLYALKVAHNANRFDRFIALDLISSILVLGSGITSIIAATETGDLKTEHYAIIGLTASSALVHWIFERVCHTHYRETLHS